MKDGQLYYELPQMKHDPYNLEGNALRVYAALYILTAKHPFTGSYATLANWIEKISPRTVNRMVDDLVERNLVSREVVNKTKKSIDGIYQLDALILPDAPLPRVRYKLIMDEYQKEVKDVERKIEAYRQEKIVEGVRHGDEGVRHGDEGVRHGDEVLKEKNQKKNNYSIYTKSSFHTKEEVEGKTATAAPQKSLEEEIVPFPTTLQEVLEYVQEKQPGISFEVARDFFVYYSAKGWRYKSNGLVRNWKAELFLFDQRGKRWEKERAAKACTRYQQGGYRGRGGDNYACGGTPPSLAQIMAEEAIRRQKEAERKIAEEHDKAANTPEAKAAAERVCAKYGNLHHFTPQC